MANDMKSLYKKVVKASFPMIPSFYSSEISTVVDMCLQRKSSRRPTCDYLLNYLNILSRKIPHLLAPPSLMAEAEFDFRNESELLRTIKIPKNLKNLSDVLPKPSYIRSGKYSFIERKKENKESSYTEREDEDLAKNKRKLPLINRRTSKNTVGKLESITPLITRKSTALSVLSNKENILTPLANGGLVMPKLLSATRKLI